MDAFLVELWPEVLALLGTAATIGASGHVILYKRDVRSAIGWVGLIWLVPGIGALLYLLLGINRIRRRAAELGRLPATPQAPPELPTGTIEACLGSEHLHLLPLARFTNRLARRPLTTGNKVVPLDSGDAAYPAMLQAIEEAQRSVTLCSYIFDNDEVGARFVAALRHAKERGVEVRVLVDAVGSRYSWPISIFTPLAKAQIPSRRFLPTRVPWRMPYANLRNHRKLLVVDGRKGFTGGMNLRVRHLTGPDGKLEIRDLHFSFEGPVVHHLQESFAEDWLFTTGERLTGAGFFPEVAAAGDVLARGISDGPDEDFNKLRWTYHGGLDCARDSVRIVTPYFLPDSSLFAALSSAALRGVEVDIILPHHNNLVLVHWACMAQLWQVLKHGCRVWLSPRPFDHSKVMLVDGCWTFLGSGNWDPRSLRLSFEFNVECYDRTLASQLEALVQQKLDQAQPLTLADVDGRALPIRLRDGAARLLSPYL